MAPIKHHRDSAARNRDKAKKRKRPDEHANHLLYRCMGDLCGEECNQELQPVSGTQQRRNNDVGHSTRLNQQSMDLDEAAGASDPDDADYVDESSSRRRGGNPPGITKAAGRVNKSKKPSPAKQIKDMPVKLGLQKAERYLCNALDFGVQAGYLTPKDAKGRVLRVASGLLQSTTSGAVKRSNTDAMDARKIERRGGGGGGPSSTNQTMKAVQRRKQSDLQDLMSQELRDNEATDGGGVDESRRHSRRHGHGKSRSRSKRHGGKRKRSGKARSRSRSKRRHGGGRRRSMGRSRSANAESNKQASGGDGSEEQDDLGDTSQETTTSTSVNSRNDDDGKSVKSTKSSKSAANNNNSNNDSQTSGEEKKRGGGDDGDAASNDEEPSDDEDEPIKK